MFSGEKKGPERILYFRDLKMQIEYLVDLPLKICYEIFAHMRDVATVMDDR